MADQSVSRSESAPQRRARASEQHVAEWLDLLNAAEQFLLAGLRREAGAARDVEPAYRHWYARQANERDSTRLNMLRELERREGQHGC